MEAAMNAPTSDQDHDPWRWLEEVDSPDALAWVEARNRETFALLGEDAGFERLARRLLEIEQRDSRIPYVVARDQWFYNFWQDSEHPRGVWRRTQWPSYLSDTPDWEVLIDVDALNRQEGEQWVWHGARCLPPERDGEPWRRALVALSRGGADADVTREFDLVDKRWVEDGFNRDESKGGLAWIDFDRVYAYTDFGPGSLTASNYPRQVRLWQRGTALASAPVVFEAEHGDVMAVAWRDLTRGFERDFVLQVTSFHSQRLIERLPDGGELVLELPEDAHASVHREWLLVQPREAWTVDGVTHPGGALLAIDYLAFKQGARAFVRLFTPSPGVALEGFSWTRHHLVLELLEHVRQRLVVLTPGQGDDWSPRALAGAPQGVLGFGPLDDEKSDEYLLSVTDFLLPPTLARGRIDDPEIEVVKRSVAEFDAAGMRVEQRFAVSLDGTRVPYFLVLPRDVSRETKPLPTLLYGYGGFEISLTPHYLAAAGVAWLSRGGAMVFANIRGGGEYGPDWHRAALKQHRHKAFEDFAAVARALVEEGVTVPSRLGIQGGSNGGLLVGNMLTHYPELFDCAVCEVPLLDMQRYHRLLAGASWIAEYGDPDSGDWDDFLHRFSPYHNLHQGTDYPAVLFTTSTRDDRVHPGHARKMAAKMAAMGCEVHYYENIEGGHGGAADAPQRARLKALAWRFLERRLMGDDRARD
ncbi:prolyl oligopeptidase [Halotalea alkalilenta]|uniref:Prolyl oligopeptidase n=2 Tax=Halotalea alkalilenta TaxID=376489 RepID=A0A172YJT0_9GAMM|nr:prolyl oligopeptidase [Halotalea alkalilenta]